MNPILVVVVVLVVLLAAVLVVGKPKKRPQEPLPQSRPVPHQEPPKPPPPIGRGLAGLKEYLRTSGKPSMPISHRPEYSASMRAAGMHKYGKLVAKAVVFCRADGTNPVMFVVSAADKVDLGVVQNLIGPGARLATETELGPLFPDCQLGAHPPFGSFYGLQTILDERFHQESDNIIFLMGHHDGSTSMAMRGYVALARPDIRRVRQTP